LVQQGRAWLDAGAIEPVLDLHRHVATSGAAAPQLLALIARAHANRGDIDLAIVEARRALELDSLVSDAYHLLGVLYLQRGEVSASIQHLERARYLEPEMPLISFHLAEAYRAALRPSTALREYRATLHKLAPLAADTVLDGVAVSWLRATCERQISQLT
jgi:chemotaxis protein methyltransferase CheR